MKKYIINLEKDINDFTDLSNYYEKEDKEIIQKYIKKLKAFLIKIEEEKKNKLKDILILKTINIEYNKIKKQSLKFKEALQKEIYFQTKI